MSQAKRSSSDQPVATPVMNSRAAARYVAATDRERVPGIAGALLFQSTKAFIGAPSNEPTWSQHACPTCPPQRQTPPNFRTGLEGPNSLRRWAPPAFLRRWNVEGPRRRATQALKWWGGRARARSCLQQQTLPHISQPPLLPL